MKLILMPRVVSLVFSKLEMHCSLISPRVSSILVVKVQSHTARVFYKKQKNDRVKLFLKSFHCSLLTERIDYKWRCSFV